VVLASLAREDTSRVDRLENRSHNDELGNRSDKDGPVDPLQGAAAEREGLWNEARGEWALAEERFREALERDPASVESRVRLAGVLLRQGRYADAERAYQEALVGGGDEDAALTGLSLVRARLGDYAGARQWLARLAERRPDDPMVLLNLGDLSVLGGDAVAGRSAWEQARRSGRASEELRERLRRRLLIYPAATTR
jgi:type IV pilus assembly protein PilF